MTGWNLVQAISPRAHVQVARALDDGSVAPYNSYPDLANVAGPCPDRPWVVHLADEDRVFRLLAFDFDAHRAPAAAAQRDAYHFVALLERLGGLPYLVCESGPSGGLHVWLAPREGLPAATVATLARVASRLYPTLDIAPLRNPVTGGVRPPGSPHRDGGRSTVLYGDVTALTQPSAGTEVFHHLLGELDRLAPATTAHEREAGDRLALIDRRGRLYLPGTKTSLGPAATEALRGPLDPAADASAVLRSVLVGAARARWRFADVEEHLRTAPGLEHARSKRAGMGRLPRTEHARHRTLAYQWDRAVRYVSSTNLDRTGASNPELTERAELVTAVVTAARARMYASPGRWIHEPEANKQRGGFGQHRAIDRLVLLELYQRALDGLTTTVRASGRTLAMSLPIERESVRESLGRLSRDGWIAVATPSEGLTATAWSIDPHGVFHREAVETRATTGLAPVVRLPQGAWRLRTHLQRELKALTDGAAHDVFLAACLGPQTGFFFGALQAHPGATEAELAAVCGATDHTTRVELARLALYSLAHVAGGRWRAADSRRREAAAHLLGVHGVRAARAARYRVEQATYAYFRADVEVLSSAAVRGPGRLRLVELPGIGATLLGAYPRKGAFKSDWRRARERIETVLAA